MMSVQKGVTTAKVSDSSTSLQHHQRSRRKVPFADKRLKPGIKTSGSHIADGKRSRTGHADTCHTPVKFMNQMLTGTCIPVGIIREFRHYKGVLHLLDRRDLHPFSIHISATSLPGIKTFIPARGINNSQQQRILVAQSDADTIGSIIMNIIRCPIQRVHYPTVGFIVIDSRTFLGYKSSLGKKFPKRSHHPLLRFLVYIRDIIMRLFLPYRFPAEVFPLFFQEISGFAGYAADRLCQYLQIFHLSTY